MFYLKYRPQTLEEIDNKKIRDRLQAILHSKRVPHALLFTGSKGTGKTSSARIVAKILNCSKNAYAEKSESFEPCNECENCLSIAASSSVDVLEIDAASNRKIDEMKDLIGRVKFSPIYSRFKIYIIDEVHMLTKESFNALLKTLEEPPSSTIFVLATTEIEKLPKTIISRCLTFNFAKAHSSEIVRMLTRISRLEKIDVDDDTLRFIANYADNSFRDAAMLLEEAVIQKNLTVDGIKALLGLKSSDDQILHAIEAGDAKKTLKLIDDYEKNGGSFKTLIEFALGELRLVLLGKSGVKIDREVNYKFTAREIATLIKLFQEAYNGLKYSPIESLPLEIAIVEYFAQKRK